MARLTKDGFVRFSSYNDLSRELSAHSDKEVTNIIERIANNYPKDRIMAALETRDALDQLIYFTSTALSACYSELVHASIPEEVDITGLRGNFIERLKQLIHRRDAVDTSLNLQAMLQVDRKRLQLPTSYEKAVATCQADSDKVVWSYLRLPQTNSYALCHLTYLEGAHCCSTTSSGDSTYQLDKVIGYLDTAFHRAKSDSKKLLFVETSGAGDKLQIQHVENISQISNTSGKATYLNVLRKYQLQV